MATTRKSIAKKIVTDTSVQIAFENGHLLEIHPAELSDEIRNRLMLHGLSQKVGDSYSGAESIEEAIAAATTAVDNLKNGDWAVRASTGGILAEAVAELQGIELPDAIEMVLSLDDDTKKALQKAPEVAAVIADIKARKARAKAKASGGVDIKALLSGGVK